ncbi:MAG: cell division protein SepF [Clostridia bacterium]|nr:cell division protein SepF [Clostridia bacterium]MBR3754545.1 cell division protein SepF [Clostridia bacterium]
MSFMDRISKFVNVNEGDYYDEVDDTELEEDYEDEVEEEAPVTKRSSFASSFRQTEKPKNNNVVDFGAQSQQRTKPQVVLAKPATFDDATGIADHINQRHMVILNLEATSRDIARRLVDFLGGVVYANDGSIRRVANSTFVIVPHGYDLGGDLLDSLENGGVYFG